MDKEQRRTAMELDVIKENNSPREDFKPPSEDPLNLQDTLPSIISESEV